MTVGIYIGTEKLDLFEDENIYVRSSVARIEDITKIFTDTSNSFTVPASDKNNRIFKHWYNANINNSFDARKKVQGLIELNGLDYKFGLFRLEKVAMKSNIASSYTITFFGNLVALKDVLQDDELSGLDLSAYDFPYEHIEISQRLDSQTFDIPFTLSSKRYYFYDSVNNLTTSNNIHYNGTNPQNGFLWSDATGSIKNLRLIEAIESKYAEYGITFSRDFFGTNEFENLYFMLSATPDTGTFSENIPFDSSTDPTINGNTILYNTTDPEMTEITYVVVPSDKSIEYTYNVFSDGVLIYSITKSGDLTQDVIDGLSTMTNLTFSISSDSVFSYEHRVSRNTKSGSNPVTVISYTDTHSIPQGNYIVSDRLPKLKVIDYITGLFKTFKLIAIVKEDGSIYVDSFANYYRKGRVWNSFERFVDFTSHDIARGVLNNEIEYNFKDAKGVLGIAFEENNGSEFGNLEYRVLDDNGQLIDGTQLNIDVPFGTEVYTKLEDNAGVDSLGLQFLGLYNEDLNSVDIEPHLHYINTEFNPTGFKMIRDDGTAFQYIGNVNSVAHTLGFVSPVYSSVFGEEFNEWDGTLISRTIFSNHHQAYIESIFNEKKRSYTFTAKNVSLEILNKIELNDVLEIREEYYRIDSYDINIVTNEITFKLINAINLDLTPVYSMSLDRVDVTLDSVEVTLDQI